MCDEWMPLVRIPMSIDQYHQLPRHPAYKYEYLRGCAVLTPRARFYHARLLLSRFAPDPELRPVEPQDLRPVADDDFPELQALFASAFSAYQPFAALDEEARLRAAAQALEKTRQGGDGPWVRQASFLIQPPLGPPSGAILITLLPDGEPDEFDSYYWSEDPPPDLLERRGGRAHLTWVFVHPQMCGEGAGTTLLRAAVAELVRLGYQQLYSTFLVGNHSSSQWHWRCGFELLPNPFSVRRMRREIRGRIGGVG